MQQLKDLTLEELKAGIYDLLVENQNNQRRVEQLNGEIARRINEPTKEVVKKEK